MDEAEVTLLFERIPGGEVLRNPSTGRYQPVSMICKECGSLVAAIAGPEGQNHYYLKLHENSHAE